MAVLVLVAMLYSRFAGAELPTSVDCSCQNQTCGTDCLRAPNGPHATASDSTPLRRGECAKYLQLAFRQRIRVLDTGQPIANVH